MAAHDIYSVRNAGTIPAPQAFVTCATQERLTYKQCGAAPKNSLHAFPTAACL